MATADTPTPLYVPLTPEVRACAADADKGLVVISRWRIQGNPRTLRHLKLQFLDGAAAVSAHEQIAAFQDARAALGYEVGEEASKPPPPAPPTEREIEVEKAFFPEGRKIIPDPENVLRVLYDDYNPEEYRLLVENTLKTALRFLPIAPALVSSMKHFVETYRGLEIIRLTPVILRTGEIKSFGEGDYIHLHESLLKLAKEVLRTVLDRRPIHVTMDGSVKELSVSVDGVAVKLSPTQLRGIAALALLPYDHWFTLEEFCKLAFPGQPPDPKDFDAALSVFKKSYPPFGWDADSGLRRVNGAVIESLVDEAVLRAHLGQKMKA